MPTIEISSCIRGYHVYQDVWPTPVLNQELQCQREPGNLEDPFAVAVKNDEEIVGHVPRKISALCSTFLSKGGVIVSTVTGSKQYSADLAQGGMEVPCNYAFTGDDCTIQKVEKVLKLSGMSSSQVENSNSPVSKTTVTVNDSTGPDSESMASVWIHCDGLSLSVEDRNTLRDGNDLSDKHMNYGQYWIKKQFPGIGGLKSTLIITKKTYHYDKDQQPSRFLQIIHTGNHWIVTSNIGGAISEVTVYDSLNKAVSKPTEDIVKRLLKKSNVKVFAMQPQLQIGNNDCGLFALAFATSLALGEDLTSVQFDQSKLRMHAEHCFEIKKLSSFPKVEAEE